MNSLNTVMLIGRLGKDPELHYSQKGTAILKYEYCDRGVLY